ncbi:hypothetical protein IM792_20400 [Mucilaginibacter sp. JRF]|uniref:hypothetical protein n=1 Tax=Mucilaginibacter sp. JRF TaxID=2780088 RepID=UPI00188179BB|nr:hypothetical protein [Mucilaginibacter sp. JRF]MBE9586822.1 hypothetical protein [Mucilaginibacter sp. JRF]
MSNPNHHGQLVEHAIRRRGISLTDLALSLNVNRRTLYNWFESSFLKKNVIHRIGLAINHDFSVEFPHLFTSDVFSSENIRNSSHQGADSNHSEWKDKYIALLEKYNEVLASQAFVRA